MTTHVLSDTPKKSRQNVFVKISGDEYLNPGFRDWVRELSQTSSVVVCVGGGTQINEEFERRGWELKPHGPMGRESENFEQRQVARDVLEMNQCRLQDYLAEEGIHVAVVIPVLDIGTVLCPVNGDLMVRNAYLGYDRLYVVTTPDRLKKKRPEFAELSPKVEVLAFPLAV